MTITVWHTTKQGRSIGNTFRDIASATSELQRLCKRGVRAIARVDGQDEIIGRVWRTETWNWFIDPDALQLRQTAS